MKFNIEIIEDVRQTNDSDEVWKGQVKVNDSTFSYYATLDLIYVNGVGTKWQCSSVEVAVAQAALHQLDGMA